MKILKLQLMSRRTPENTNTEVVFVDTAVFSQWVSPVSGICQAVFCLVSENTQQREGRHPGVHLRSRPGLISLVCLGQGEAQHLCLGLNHTLKQNKTQIIQALKIIPGNA